MDWRVSTLRPKSKLDGALAPVQDELEAVSDRLLAELRDPIARMVVYLIASGGKRLRPALVLLAGNSGPAPDRKGLIDAATAVELIHTATLIHDDIIDRSMLRRSQPSFHHRWGTERAVLMGDYLYATAFTILARLSVPSVTQVMADVCQQLCRGELREVEARNRLDLTEEEYLEIICDKTASLIGGCCHIGATLGRCEAKATQRLTKFGVTFGLVFQIIDDCLDLTGDQQELGKSILSDLDKGTLSLPIIYLTQMLSARERHRLFEPLRSAGGRTIDPVLLRRIATAAHSCGAIAKAKRRARTLIQEAQDSLAHVPLNGLKDSYQWLANYAVNRRS